MHSLLFAAALFLAPPTHALTTKASPRPARPRAELLASSGKPLLPAPELVAEAIGTGLITLLGTGTVSAAVYTGAQNGLWQIAVVWGAAVALAAYTTASISGAHLNPAVTLALVVFKGFPMGKALAYAIAQTVGATIAAVINYATFAKAIASFETTNDIVRGAAGSSASAPGVLGFGAHGVSLLGATALEALQMGVLMFVILSVTHDDSAAPSGGACALIGLTVAVLISVYGPLTSAGFNPARAIGPCVVAAASGWGSKEAFKGLGAYVAGPLVGALGGGLAHRAIYAASD